MSGGVQMHLMGRGALKSCATIFLDVVSQLIETLAKEDCSQTNPHMIQ